MPRSRRVELAIRRSTVIQRSARVMQIEGMFSVPPTQKSEVSWDVVLPLEERDWQVGLIVGPSGCGKSTLAKEAFGRQLVSGFDWSPDRSIVDDFPKTMSIKDIVTLLSSVGFSSPPSWLRPFSVLSNGEQFRVTMARAMAECDGLFVVDEFTSVVDRQVAQIGSSAIARTVRSRGQQFVAVACHYDIIEWLQPDWTFEPATKTFQWRELQRRPAIQLTIQRVDKAAWEVFRKHHYLDTSLHVAASCFVAFVKRQPAAFTAVLSFPHPIRSGWREHRTVCLPDFQGVGIGNVLSAYVASLYRATGKPYFSNTGHPGMVRHRASSPLWLMNRAPSRVTAPGKTSSTTAGTRDSNSCNRFTAGFEYVGPSRSHEAKFFGVL